MSSNSTKLHYPRSQAIRSLTRVLSDHEALDDVLAKEDGSMPPAARAWLQEIASGTLRWKGRLDLAIDSVALRKKPTGWLRKAMLVGAYQLIAQDRVQAGAVVSETVTEVKRKEGEAPAKFANACLRKLAEHATHFRDLPYDASASLADAAKWASLPEWLWKRLVSEHGLEWAQAYAQASLERPVTWIRVQSGQTPPEGAELGPVVGSYRIGPSGAAIPERLGFREGSFFVQDISSQTLIAEVTREVRSVLGEPNSISVLDLCAAPGGKSAGLSWNGFQVSATDRPTHKEGEDHSRFGLLRQTLSRVAPSARVVSRSEVGVLPAQDVVWVDSPCSGTGILRRHPDVRWLRQEKELEALALVQKELLKEAWAKVRTGGFLVYSVCSVLKSEGPVRVQELREESGADAGQIIREWFLSPQETPHGDGFWAVLLRK